MNPELVYNRTGKSPKMEKNDWAVFFYVSVIPTIIITSIMVLLVWCFIRGISREDYKISLQNLFRLLAMLFFFSKQAIIEFWT